LANIRSQIKRNRQNEKRREKNSQFKSSIRTAFKKVVKASESKNNSDQLKKMLVGFITIIDKAAARRVIHKKTASRKKSRLAKRVNAALQNKS
jgi:small subunit ribosomal protein S20